MNRSLLGSTAGVMPAMSSEGNYFGFDLAYDKTNSPNASVSYGAAQYNGNISGMQWKSRGDQAGRLYDFSYDAASRLSVADFKQNPSGSSTWGKTEVDYTVNNLSYDLNGNIKTMNQYLNDKGTNAIDQMTVRNQHLSEFIYD